MAKILRIASLGLVLLFSTFAHAEKVDSYYNIKVGEKLLINNSIDIILLAIKDSRCPKGVYCVWEGIAQAVFELNYNGSRQIFHLSENPFYDRQVSIDGFMVRLVNIHWSSSSQNQNQNQHQSNMSVTIQVSEEA